MGAPRFVRFRKGMALATVIAIMFILFVIGVSISLIAVSHAGYTLNTKNEAEALAASRAGLYRAVLVAKGVPDWSGNKLSNQMNLSAPGIQYPDPTNHGAYFKISVDAASGQPTSNTALISSTGYVANGSKVLKSKQINAFIHQQYPLSAGAAFYSSSCITSNGNPTPTCTNQGYFVSMTCDPTKINIVSPCQKVAQPTDSSLWPFPDINYSGAATDAENNHVANYSLQPGMTPIGGGACVSDQGVPGTCTHHFSIASSFHLSNFFKNGGTTYTYYNTAGVPVSGLSGPVGSNYFEAPPGSGSTINLDLPGNTCAGPDDGSTENPASSGCINPPYSATPPILCAPFPGNPPNAPNTYTAPPQPSGGYLYGPNFLIIKNASLTINGNATYVGVIIVQGGSVTIQGSLTLDGAIYSTGGIMGGGAGFTANYDKQCVEGLGNLWEPLVVIDSLWIGTQPSNP